MHWLSRRRAPRPHAAGFSLAELMVVVVIIGLLATLVVPNVLSRFQTAQREKALADITALSSALDDYAVHNAGRYPDSLEVLVTPDVNGATFLRQSALPLDPWGFEYGYEAPVSGRPRPRVYSLGQDGAPGGEGLAEDLDETTKERERRSS